MAEGEPEVIDVIERSFAAVVPDAPVELLLADNSHAHLLRMAAVGPDGEPPACSVDSPDRCPPLGGPRCRSSGTATISMRARNSATGRRASVRSLRARLHHGADGGVIHATDKPEAKVEEAQIQDLTTLAKLAGARIGLLG